MKLLPVWTIIAFLFLTSCGSMPVLPAVLPTFPTTGTPRVIAPTRTLLTPSPLDLSATPTLTPVGIVVSTFSPTIIPSEAIPSTPIPFLNISISGCNTSMDITHGLGEVTNAYVVIRNTSSLELTNVCSTLSASDEDRSHPDRTQCTSQLPSGNQIMLKLTVDTGFQEDTAIQVDVISDQGIAASSNQPSCKAIGIPGWIPEKVGVTEPIP